MLKNYKGKDEQRLRIVPYKNEMVFLGEITKKLLYEVINFSYRPILYAVKFVLHLKFILVDQRYHANSNILTIFLATILYMGEIKADAESLCHHIFKGNFLGELDRVILMVEDKLTILHLG